MLSRAALRQLLQKVLLSDADLMALLGDHFPGVASRVSDGMDRMAKLTLLLDRAEHPQILAALRSFDEERCRAAEATLSPAASLPSPYRGLSAFEIEDAGVFFGREALIETVWTRLLGLQVLGTRLLGIVGPSGSGKSSLVRAGLLATLVGRPIPGPKPVRFTLLRPGSHPVEALARALLQISSGSAARGGSVAFELGAYRRLCDDLLAENRHGKWDGLHLFASALPDIDSSPLFIVVDQLEEIYTLCRDEREREAFLQLLSLAAKDPGRQVSVIVTLRSDFLGETLRRHPDLNRLIADQCVVVGAMSEDELRRAISEPARRAGCPIDPDTVEQLLEQARGNQGTLPLLEFALSRVWEGLQAGKTASERLREIGGVGGALAGKAQQLYDLLPEGEKSLLRRALVRLVQLGEGTRDTRRRMAIPDLCGYGDAEQDMLSVLRRFSNEDTRLVTLFLSADGKSIMAEVTHEALFEHWRPLREWIDSGRQDHRLHQRIAEATRLWEESGRPPGRLWRPPDIDLLRDFHSRRASELTRLELEFYESGRKQQETELAAKQEAALRLATAYEELRQQLLSTYVEQGRQELLDGHPHRGALWLQRAYREGSRHPMLRYLLKDALRSCLQLRSILVCHRDRVQRVAFDRTGTILATASRDGTAALWSVQRGELLAVLSRHQGALRGLCFSPDGRRLLTAGADGLACIWDVGSGHHIASLRGHGEGVELALYSPDGNLILTAGEDAVARLWSAHNGKLLRELRGHSDTVRECCFSPDGGRVLTCSSDHSARLWDVQGEGSRIVCSSQEAAGPMLSCTFSPDGLRIAISAHDGSVRIVNLWSMAEHALVQDHESSVVCVTFSPDNRYLLTAGHDQRARVFDVAGGRKLFDLVGHSNALSTARYSPDGGTIATGSWDGTVRLWDASTGRPLDVLHGHLGPVTELAFHPDGALLASGSDDTTARLWDLTQETVAVELRGHQRPVDRARYFAGGQGVVTAGQDWTARIWDAQTGCDRHALIGHGGAILDLDVTADGRRILTGSNDKTARLWDGETGAPLAELAGNGGAVNHVQLSSDGRWAATASASTLSVFEPERGQKLFSATLGSRICCLAGSPDTRLLAVGTSGGAVQVFDVGGGRLIADLRAHTGLINSVAFRPDSQALITASEDQTACIFALQPPRLLRKLSGHMGGVQHAVYAPQGGRVATGSRDQTARIWEPDSGRLLAELKGHSEYVRTVDFSPDGQRVATASRDHTVRIWDARGGRALSILRGHAGPVRGACFSPDGRRLLSVSLDSVVCIWDVDAETRSADEVALLIDYASSYRCEGEVIVPITQQTSSGAPLLRLLPKRPPQQREGRRLVRLAVLASRQGDYERARHELGQAKEVFTAIGDESWLATLVWTQAALLELSGNPDKAKPLYEQAETRLRAIHRRPESLAAALIALANFAHERLWQPAAALRAADQALALAPDHLVGRIDRCESLCALGQFREAQAGLETLWPLCSRLNARLNVATLAWVSCRLGGLAAPRALWTSRLLEAYGELPMGGEFPCNFGGSRTALLRLRPIPPNLPDVLSFLDLMERSKSSETLTRLTTLTQAP